MSFDPFLSYTHAKIRLKVCGSSLCTQSWLDFALEHALAVDAVWQEWDIKKQVLILKSNQFKSVILKSKADERKNYILNPNLGRILDDSSSNKLKKFLPPKANEVLVVVSNGLSSLSMQHHLLPLLNCLREEFAKASLAFAYQKVFLVNNARVGLIDDIGNSVKPDVGLIIVGERPGLSCPDSISIYLTYKPKKGRCDADRNCISNIRTPHGLSYEMASLKAVYLIKESIRRKISGVILKDETNLLL